MSKYEIGKKQHIYTKGNASSAIKVYEDDKFNLSLGGTNGWTQDGHRSEPIAWLSFCNESIFIFGKGFEVAKKCKTDAEYRKFCEKSLIQTLNKYPDLLFTMLQRSEDNGRREGRQQIKDQFHALMR